MKRAGAVLLALLASCGDPPVAPIVQPAVDLVRRLDPDRAAGWREPPDLPELQPARMVSRRLRPYIRRVALPGASGGPDERLSILMPAGARIGFKLPVPEGGVLELALGAVAVADGAPAVVAEVSVEEGREETRVLVEELNGLRSEIWSDHRIDLSRWSGRTVSLTLRTRGGAPSTWLAWASPELRGPSGEARHASVSPSLLLVSIDTLRADHLGCYGYARPTSPHLDAFAARSFRFAEAISSAPWTYPAHRSLFSGVYPKSTGGRRRLPLAQVLWRSGYRTLAAAGGGQLDYRLGFSRGFERYREFDWIRAPQAIAEEIAILGERPFFYFLHTYEVHDPYLDTRFAEGLPSGRLVGEFSHRLWRSVKRTLTAGEQAYVEALYDGDIAFTDERLGHLLAALENRGLLDHAVVVLTSDHGEQFWEHGTWRHGQSLYDHQLLVPLVVWVPPALRDAFGIPDGSAVITEPVRLVDLYPTVLNLLGVSIEHDIQGRSLVPLMQRQSLREVPALAEDLNLEHEESKAVRFRGFKYISRIDATGAQTRELYDLATDPGERLNLVDERPDQADRLHAHLERLAGDEWWRSAVEETQDRDLPEDLRRKLEALGYLGN
jgi:arylsulfatase A-like enzyme